MSDISFPVKASAEQPIEAEFSATFKNSAGVGVHAPGFFNGDREYVIRFHSPDARNVELRHAFDIAGVGWQAGGTDSSTARQGRRGGVVLDPDNRRNFQYENGDNYYPIAFESDWLLALDAENPVDIPVTRQFVDSLASNGFNQVVMNVFAYDVNWKKDERLVQEYEYGSPGCFRLAETTHSPIIRR